MLAALSYIFDRDDWQQAIREAPAALEKSASDELVVTNNPFATRLPEHSSAQFSRTEEPPVDGFVTGDF